MKRDANNKPSRKMNKREQEHARLEKLFPKLAIGESGTFQGETVQRVSVKLYCCNGFPMRRTKAEVINKHNSAPIQLCHRDTGKPESSPSSAKEIAAVKLREAATALEAAAQALEHAADVATDNNQPETANRCRALAEDQRKAADAARRDAAFTL